MKRSLQEYVELVVFGLIALLVGTGLLWVLGWVLSLGGIVLKGLAGLLWMLLRFIVPVAIAGGLVYFLVKAAQDRQKPAPTVAGSGTAGSASSGPAGTSAATQGAAIVVDGSVVTAADAAAHTTADAVAGAAADARAAVEDADAVLADATTDVADAAEDSLAGSTDEDEEDDSQA